MERSRPRLSGARKRPVEPGFLRLSRPESRALEVHLEVMRRGGSIRASWTEGLISWPAAEPAYLGSVIGAFRPPWSGSQDPREA
jgi:hypothetical protein